MIPARGDVVTYRNFLDVEVRVVVMDVAGQTFTGATADEETVWGYAHQITDNEGRLR